MENEKVSFFLLRNGKFFNKKDINDVERIVSKVDTDSIAKLSVFSSDAKNGNVHIGDIVVVVNGNPGSNSSLILKSVSAVDDSDNNVADSNRTASFSIASDDNKLKSLKVDSKALC